jgi:hypothetical protein
MGRSIAVIVFIAIIGATGIYFAQRTTVARGYVVAGDLVKTNAAVKAMTCDDDIPIANRGATFHCGVEFKNGNVARIRFTIDRNGQITQAEKAASPDQPAVKKTADPWGD